MAKRMNPNDAPKPRKKIPVGIHEAVAWAHTKHGGPIWVRVYKDRKGEWRWTIKATTNGKKLATSGEGYKREAAARSALRTIAAYLPDHAW